MARFCTVYVAHIAYSCSFDVQYRECESLGLEDFPTSERLQWHGHQPGKPDWSEASRFVAFTMVDITLTTIITIVITKTVFLPLSTSKGDLKSIDDFLCICCCRRMKPKARSTWPSTPATCRWSSGFQSALVSDGSRWWTQARKHRMTSSPTAYQTVLSQSTSSLISSTPISTLCLATLLSSLYCALMSNRREYIKEYTVVVVL